MIQCEQIAHLQEGMKHVFLNTVCDLCICHKDSVKFVQTAFMKYSYQVKESIYLV